MASEAAPNTDEALRESEDRYRRLLAAVTTYTYCVKVERGAPISTEHNRGCVSATGYTPAEYAADPHLWIRMVHPGDRELVERHVARVLRGEQAPPIEHRLLHRDGTTRWIRDTIVLHYDEHGRVVRYDGLVQDITERKQAEERFRSLLESAPDAIVAVDQNGKIILVNAQTERLSGYSRQELLGQAVELLVPESVRRKHVQHRADYLAAPRPRPMNSGRELSARGKNGGKFPVEISLGPLETDEGLLVMSVLRDIAERKRVEQLMRENAAQMLAAQRIQEHLLPRQPPAVPGFEIAGSTYPAEFTSGDYFDFLPMGGQAVGIAIGDVTGHGFGPALLMASTRAYLRSLIDVFHGLGEILAHVNARLLQEIEEDRFVTLLLARLDPRSRSLVYTSAGHSTAYVLDAHGAIKARLESTSLPLAVLPHAEFPVSEPIVLQSGDLVLLLTDGILEARSDDVPFGSGRVLEIVRRHSRAPAREIIDELYQAVRQFTGVGPIDDMTAVVLKCL